MARNCMVRSSSRNWRQSSQCSTCRHWYACTTCGFSRAITDHPTTAQHAQTPTIGPHTEKAKSNVHWFVVPALRVQMTNHFCVAQFQTFRVTRPVTVREGMPRVHGTGRVAIKAEQLCRLPTPPHPLRQSPQNTRRCPHPRERQSPNDAPPPLPRGGAMMSGFQTTKHDPDLMRVELNSVVRGGGGAMCQDPNLTFPLQLHWNQRKCSSAPWTFFGSPPSRGCAAGVCHKGSKSMPVGASGCTYVFAFQEGNGACEDPLHLTCPPPAQLPATKWGERKNRRKWGKMG